ncbi:hypothetical protein ABZT48_19955 [Streptomyces avermitilis]|uniref:hypothetical protein n=1 Tax=Streptomyces avermitilis TaxID=33903 RepID=UPI00339F136B
MSILNSPTMVAAVTALSTLFASALTGWISLRVQRHQLDRQAALAAAERATQLREGRREERKLAYSEFITQAVRTADANLAMCRPEASDPAVFEEVHSAAKARLAELWPMLALVNMLGPQPIAAMADKVPLALRTELDVAKQHPGGPPSVLYRASAKRIRAQREFASSARALIEELPS